MSMDLGTVLVSEATPTGRVASDPSMDDWLWLRPSDGTWHKYNTSTGQWDIVEVAAHEHPGLGGGITGEFEGRLKKIKVENGFITEIEVEE